MNTLPARIAQAFFLPVCCTVMLSCYSGRKSEATKVLASTQVLLATETKEVTQIKDDKDRQLAEENIDTTIDNRIVSKLNNYNAQLDAVRSKTTELETLLANRRNFRKNYKTVVLPALAEMDSFAKKSGVRMSKYQMIKDGVAQSKKRLYEMAAFFGSGKYEIPEEKASMANTLFTPVIDSLVTFSNLYPTLDQTGTLVVNGYADGMDISDSSELYTLLLTALKKATATKEQMNMQLSQLRADAISSLLEKLVYVKKDAFKTWSTFNINLFQYGQGETYPTKTIKDYQVDDERRRVVLIYWSVLPKD